MSSLDYNEVRAKLRPYAKAKKWNKCFCIGAHKTGTSTMNRVMDLMGFDCAPQAEIEMATVEQIQHGIYRDLRELVSRYDFFQDSPFAVGLTWVALDALFPDSKFIFTYRDPESWWKSRIDFEAKRFGLSPEQVNYENISALLPEKGYLRIGYEESLAPYYGSVCVDSRTLSVYENPSLSYDKQVNVDLYVSRRDAILKYFAKRRSDLLFIELSKESDVRRIVEFLEMPDWINFSLPRYNSSDTLEELQGVQLLDSRLLKALRRS